MTATAALALTGVAAGATVTVPAPCVRTDAPVTVSGAGFAPGAPVRLTGAGITTPGDVRAGPDGAFGATISVSAISVRPAFTRQITLNATDGINSAATGFRAAWPSVQIRDSARYAALRRFVRVVGAGLIPGRPVYVHFLAGNRRAVARRRVVRRAGRCGEFSARVRLFDFRARRTATRWRYQVDNRRRFRRTTRPRATIDYFRRAAVPLAGLREKMIGPSRPRFYR